MKRRQFIAKTMAYGMGASDLRTPAASVAHMKPDATGAAACNIALLGQIVIQKAVDTAIWPGRAALQHRLSTAHGVFANLESVIAQPRAGTLTRARLTLHAADPSALKTLAYLSVNLLGMANNHTFDLHSDGMLNTMETLSRAGIPFAGLGESCAAASAPAYAATGEVNTAVVAFATGMLRPGAAAGAHKIGVNEVRRLADGVAHPDDVTRILAAIRTAAARADVVIACHDNHERGPGRDAVPDWQRELAHQCIRGGASVFVSHGVPVLQGMEIYRGAPLLFGLGNFMFQVHKPIGAYEAGAWDGVIAFCAFRNGRCRQVRLLPIVLNERARDGTANSAERGLPRAAGCMTSSIISKRVVPHSVRTSR